jgi:hypothetical protein
MFVTRLHSCAAFFRWKCWLPTSCDRQSHSAVRQSTGNGCAAVPTRLKRTYLACAHAQWMHSLERLNDSAATQAGACCVNKVPLFDRFPFGPRHQSAPLVPKPSLADEMRTTSELAVSPLTVRLKRRCSFALRHAIGMGCREAHLCAAASASSRCANAMMPLASERSREPRTLRKRQKRRRMDVNTHKSHQRWALARASTVHHSSTTEL